MEHILTFLLPVAIVVENIAENVGCPQITDVFIWISGNENRDHLIPQGDGANLKGMKEQKQGIILKQIMKREPRERKPLLESKIC